MKKTDLQTIKDIAIDLLMIPVEPNTEMAPLIISHPFFNSGITMHPISREMVNILEDEDALSEVRNKIKEYIYDAENVFSIIVMMNKPYLRTYFSFINEYLSAKDYGELLANIWQSTELPSTEVNADLEEMLLWFKKADKKYLMSKSELEKYAALPEKVTIYRGINDYIEGESEKGLSWTLSLETAKFFANRFDRENTVILTAEIDKSLILAYFEYEDEVIVDSRNLTSVGFH